MSVSKHKRKSAFTKDMIERLEVNRSGRLTGSQWIAIVTQPLIPLGLLILAALLVFGVRLPLIFRALPFLFALFALLFALPIFMRARRYARLPVQFMRMVGVGRRGWRGRMHFRTQKGREIAFGTRLAPPMPIQSDDEYMVYYLEDGLNHIFLSAAPAEHDSAADWLPTPVFHQRYARRINAKPIKRF